MPAPVVRFKNLEAVITSHLVREEVPFRYGIGFEKATHATTFATIFISVEGEREQASENAADSRTRFEVFGRVSKPSGRTVNTFEGALPGDEECNSS